MDSPKNPPKLENPTIELVPSSYQPSKAELEEEIHIEATPEDLARAVGRQVEIRYRSQD